MMFLLKICLLGDGAVGKSALKERYLGKGFSSNYLMTIGADFAVKEVEIDGNIVKFQIWDLSGQQRFDAVRSLYYRGSHGAIMVYDVTRRDTYLNIKNWLEELKNHIRTGIVPPLVLLGNKVDLRLEIPEHLTTSLGIKMGKILAQDYSLPEIPYFETSAKTGEMINEAFTKLARLVIQSAKSSK